MPTTVVARTPAVTATIAPRASRWDSLDVLRGVALCFMVTHHLHNWAAGGFRDRFVGFPGFAVTDLAAPAFAVGVGAAAYLVGHQIGSGPALDRARAARAMRRWGEVLALGLLLDVVVDGGVDGGGVLPTLAALGATITVMAALGLRWPHAWWLLAGVAALASVPVTTDADPIGLPAELWAGPFSVVVYGVFGAAGAALAAASHRAGERSIPLVPAAVAILVAGSLAYLAFGARVAPEGFWPPDRSPGGLAYTVWGLVGTLVLWALARALAGLESPLVRGLARCGRRTLLVFGAHYAIKVALQHTGHLRELTGTGWLWATWAAVAVVCALSMLPRPTRDDPI